MKILTLGYLLTVSLMIPAYGQVNLILNGDFEKTTDPWYGQKLQLKDGIKKEVPSPEMLAHETKDTADQSAGALKVTIKRDPAFIYWSHHSGAICKLHTQVPPNKNVKVTFHARHVEGGQILSVQRLWGAGGTSTLLEDNWSRHEVILHSTNAIGALVFSLVPNDSAGIQELTDGVFLLDNVSVVAEN